MGVSLDNVEETFTVGSCGQLGKLERVKSGEFTNLTTGPGASSWRDFVGTKRRKCPLKLA